MKRPKLKKQSKRVSCSKRYKIQKKVREHNRKLRKQAKKKGLTKRPKKDPGVPSSAPFKEEVLREAEQRRLQIEEEKEKKKQAQREEQAKKRKKEKETANDKSEPKAKKARQEENGKAAKKAAAPDRTSSQFLCAELKKVLDSSDVVVEVLDARDPLGCRCPQLEELVVQRGDAIKLIFLLTKIDLVPKENVVGWMEYLQQEFPVVAFKASTQLQYKTVQAKRKRKQAQGNLLDRSRGAASHGCSGLNGLLTSYAETMQRDSPLRVGVVGYPNVGKSSLINSMKEILACNAGPKGGLTKSMQEVHIAKNVKLLDSPPILASPSNPPASLALRSLQAEESKEGTLEGVQTLLKHCDMTQVMLQYNVPEFKNSLEFLTLFAKKRGFLQKGGVANTAQAASTFLADWTGGSLSYHCKVPDSHATPAHPANAAAAGTPSVWNLDKLNSDNAETLRGVKFPNRASSIGFTSSGPTAGLLTFSEVTRQEAVVAPMEEGVEENMEAAESAEVPEAEEVTLKENGPVQLQPVPVVINLGAAAAVSDDAYDFNVDFK